ncbi:hypothetical protein BU26DRAFT_498376 [Trematosphaeria pertusa]|uniref:Uncharacterized protein n=1 Tax=Trematosphaeria pertusa TaxID=390896 RepID=A0A6A6IYC8_9PLEO|nr:uncharacterized protein BU26DRAFT_498376 [Trematosphaeria pertusa]KAF2255561.1 hypothetical protein BU26DRAFT_498376 [Trematosphaeria pertusa]
MVVMWTPDPSGQVASPAVALAVGVRTERVRRRTKFETHIPPIRWGPHLPIRSQQEGTSTTTVLLFSQSNAACPPMDVQPGPSVLFAAGNRIALIVTYLHGWRDIPSIPNIFDLQSSSSRASSVFGIPVMCPQNDSTIASKGLQGGYGRPRWHLSNIYFWETWFMHLTLRSYPEAAAIRNYHYHYTSPVHQSIDRPVEQHHRHLSVHESISRHLLLSLAPPFITSAVAGSSPLRAPGGSALLAISVHFYGTPSSWPMKIS